MRRYTVEHKHSNQQCTTQIYVRKTLVGKEIHTPKHIPMYFSINNEGYNTLLETIFVGVCHNKIFGEILIA
jgi:hypothetical protein